MAKLIGIPEKTLFLVFLAILVFSEAVQGFTSVCDRPSKNLQGSCTNNEACRDACMSENDGLVFGGGCQTVTSLNQSGFDDCMKPATANFNDCQRFGGLRCDTFFEEEQNDCKSKNTIKTGERCTCSYLC